MHSYSILPYSPVVVLFVNCFSLSLSLSLNYIFSIQFKESLLAWETYVYISKAYEMYNKQTEINNKKLTVNITLTNVPKE